MNSAESKEFTKLWVEMIQKGGPKNWTTYTWYEVGNDLGAGASAMIFDADILGYFMNGGQQGGRQPRLSCRSAPNPAAAAPTPNVWIWSLAMCAFSQQPDAGWYFMQWASGTEHTTFGATKMDLVNPVRQSVWDDGDFHKRLESYPGYLDQYKASAAGLEDLLHAAAAVLRPDHRMGGQPAEDGGQGGAGRRGPRPAGRVHRHAAEGRRPGRLTPSPRGPAFAPLVRTAALRPRRRLSPGGGGAQRPTSRQDPDRGNHHRRHSAPNAPPRRPRPLPYLLSLPALLVYDRDPDPVLHRRVLFAAALQPGLPGRRARCIWFGQLT